MTNSELLKNSFRYICYSIIAWDDPDRKCEDDPKNTIYFFSEEYKKQVCKPIENLRKSGKITYYENKNTDTSFNVIDTGKEVIIAFRGSDSKQDWLSDFNFFKVKFKEANEYTSQTLASHLSKEEYNKLIFEEYVKSCEDLTDGFVDFFRKCQLVNSFKSENGFSFFKNIVRNISSDDIKSNNFIHDLFNKFKFSLSFHRGFLTQFDSIIDQFFTVIEKNKGRKITIVGHSLGAALAKLGFMFSALKYPEYFNDISCYIYGTPKIGNKFVNDFISKIGNGKCFVVNIESDLVKTLPPLNFGFPEPMDNIRIKTIKCPFPTKCDHTLFYYLYCYQNKSPIEFNKK